MAWKGEVRVGDPGEWCAYGTDGWPHAWAPIVVTGIRAHGDDMPFTDPDDDSSEAECQIECEDTRTGRRAWNDLSRFREAATRSDPTPASKSDAITEKST